MKYGFGVDVGGTTVKLGLLSEAGELLEKWELPTRTENGGENILPDIARSVQDCMARRGLSRDDCLGLGIGVPGPVDASGMVNRCVNLNWGVFNLHDALGILTGLRVRAGNDANCAALGEFWMGGGSGCRSAIFVTLGTGIGGGVIVDGRLLTGAHGVGGELGHIEISAPDKAPCTCGKRGCVEQYASANGIVRVTKKRLAESAEPSCLRAMEHFACKDVFDARPQRRRPSRSKRSSRCSTIWARHWQTPAASATRSASSSAAGVSRAGDYLLRGVERHFRAHMFHACKDTQFALATLGNDAGDVRCVPSAGLIFPA